MNQVEYEKTYPRYCRGCKGWGTYKAISPTVRMWDCDECIGKRHCPRCGGSQLDTRDICASCGWQRDDANRGLPGSAVI